MNRMFVALPLAGLSLVGAITTTAHHTSSAPHVSAASIVTPVVPAEDRLAEVRDIRASRSRLVAVPKATHKPVVHVVVKPKIIHHHVHHYQALKKEPSGGCSDWRASLGTDEAWIYQHESGMDPTPNDVNPQSGARGLGQLLPSTYRNLGIPADWDPCHERDAARVYMHERYHSWSNARSFWEANRWW